MVAPTPATIPPSRADDLFVAPTDPPRQARALAVIPLSTGNGYRVPALLLPPEDAPDDAPPPDPLNDTVTVVFVNPSAPGDDDAPPPFTLPHPYDWTAMRDLSCPLACELRPGDMLPPASGVPGRPNEHSASPVVLGPQAVLSVLWDSYDQMVIVQTKDTTGQLRRYKRGPEDMVDFTRPYTRPKIRTTRRAVQPESFQGPFVSRKGAQFVLQERSSRGGRLPKGAPRFDPELPPQFDPETGDLIPYVVMLPSRNEVMEGTWRSPTTFSPTARAMPEVRSILRAGGYLT